MKLRQTKIQTRAIIGASPWTQPEVTCHSGCVYGSSADFRAGAGVSKAASQLAEDFPFPLAQEEEVEKRSIEVAENQENGRQKAVVKKKNVHKVYRMHEDLGPGRDGPPESDRIKEYTVNIKPI